MFRKKSPKVPDAIELAVSEFRAVAEAALLRSVGQPTASMIYCHRREVEAELKNLTHRAVVAFVAHRARHILLDRGQSLVMGSSIYSKLSGIIGMAESFAEGKQLALGEELLADEDIEIEDFFGSNDWMFLVQNVVKSTWNFDESIFCAKNLACWAGQGQARAFWRDVEAICRASRGLPGTEGEAIPPESSNLSGPEVL